MKIMSKSPMHLHFFSLILLCYVSLSSYVSTSYLFNSSVVGLVACHPHRIQALTEFNNEFDTSHCNHSNPFNGVWCDNSTGAITVLRLQSCLKGSLKPNSSLFRLHHLRFLDLSQNNFTSSSLPYEIGNLNRLEVLDLSNNRFVGHVPSSVNNLSLLAYFSLSQNEFTGSFPLIGNLTKLVVLDLSHNHFSGTLNPNSSLFELHHLRYLNLGYNNFSSSSIPSEFGNLNTLEVLSLQSNDFFGQVPPTISNLTSLTKLYLDKNKLTGSFPLVQNLTKLVVLDLSNNHFSGTLNPNSSLFELHHLRYLILDFNNFSSSSIPSEFGNLNRLEVLSLSYNDFFGQVPPTISNLTSLTKLYLDKNKLTGSFPLVQNLTKLTLLDLSNNHFSGTLNPNSSLSELHHLCYLDLGFNNFSSSSIPSEFGNLNRLEFLSLSSNEFFGQVPPTISNLTSLTVLYLDRNKLTGSFPLIKNLTKLSDINLSDNRIKGKVPEWFWSLPCLNKVYIGKNSFNGLEGPAEVLVNSSVKLLDLQHNCFEGALPIPPLSIVIFATKANRFTGSIPLSVCNCKSLTVLDLPYNNLTGPIPQCLSNLTHVILRKNNLEGSIPDVFNAGASLRTFDVGYNQLTGKLPRSLVNCSSLQFLSADNNEIEDSFPFWLKALPNLQVLTLSSNKFFGPISLPDQGPLGFPELRIFEISDNGFTGSLPPNYFLSWKASPLMNEDGGRYMGTYGTNYYTYWNQIDLRYKGVSMENQQVLTAYAAIDFSGNRLNGKIPESIGLLKALIALNLSNNAFTGHIPLSFSNLTKLESLDLSSNQLSGTIPNGLGSLSFLAYINVSHNQLKGEIPQGTQITGQSKSSFEGNAGLCGLPLQETCFGTNAPPTQQPKEEYEEEEEEEEEVLNWKGVVIGYGPGVLLGLAIAQVVVSYKPQWLAKIIGRIVFYL